MQGAVTVGTGWLVQGWLAALSAVLALVVRMLFVTPGQTDLARQGQCVHARKLLTIYIVGYKG
jgi:hypothetical protein